MSSAHPDAWPSKRIDSPLHAPTWLEEQEMQGLTRLLRKGLILAGLFLFHVSAGRAQSSGTIEGVVKDPSGAVVPGASVEISYAVSGYNRRATTDTDGSSASRTCRSIPIT